MARRAVPATDERERTLIALSTLYCWDSVPGRAPLEADRVLLRTMDVGTWQDLLRLERVFGRERLRQALSGSSAGALSLRSWSFWHYRLGLADADIPPPPVPQRLVG